MATVPLMIKLTAARNIMCQTQMLAYKELLVFLRIDSEFTDADLSDALSYFHNHERWILTEAQLDDICEIRPGDHR